MRQSDLDETTGPPDIPGILMVSCYGGIDVLTLGISSLAFTSGDPRWATHKQAEMQGGLVRRGECVRPAFFQAARSPCRQ